MIKYIIIVIFFITVGCSNDKIQEKSNISSLKDSIMVDKNDKVVRSEEEWKKILTPEQYAVMREKGTERPFSGEYEDFWEKGNYKCAACGNELFNSDTKFDAHCGWPSFYEAVDQSKVNITKDYSHGMVRDEVTCAKCGAHLGHIFNDGPKPTGKRYCMNSISLKFEKE